MRLLMLVAGPALVLAACSGRNQPDTTANADQSLSAQSFSSNDVTAIDAVTGDASNMAADMNYEELDENLGNVRLQARLAPVVPRRPLGQLCLVHARGLEQGARRGAVEPRIVPRRKIVVATRHLAFGVVSEKCS